MFEVLTPDRLDPQRRYRVLYVLSAVGRSDRGALASLRQLDVPNRYQWICVLPEIGGWYGNHATDPHRQTADYLRHTIVPATESRYPTVPGKEGRLLLGFSKSGWGALSLVFNYPDFFGYAASWDAPLLWDDAGFGQINTDAAYGTLESYRRQHPVESAKRSAAAFRDRARVVVLGRQYWGDHNRRYHELLDELQIKHVFRDDLGPPHEWNVGWLGPAVAELAALTESA